MVMDGNGLGAMFCQIPRNQPAQIFGPTGYQNGFALMLWSTMLGAPLHVSGADGCGSRFLLLPYQLQ
ncbi:hypothetical protein BJI49_08430 [Acetobacter pasteurianus]|nr:hypothetical protein BJI49_08430 [Acetobacter pasteurianus]